ncbi:MAG: glycine betaine ABC transporter substrate-binding protein [Homoserinimonas sp.]
MRRTSLLAIVGASALLLSGCSLSGSAKGDAPGGASVDGPLSGVTITVGSKDFTEQLVLCEITAQRLESQGATVERVCSLNGSATVRAAEESGDIDLYWEYTGTGWTAHLTQTEIIADATEQYEKVRDMDLAENQIAWLPPADANNTYAIVVEEGTAERLKVKTLSDYAELSVKSPDEASFCGASEFFGRDDGWDGLTKSYGITVPQDKVATLAEGPIYNSVATGNPCNFGEAFATDGRIAALGLVVLEDDKNFFPFYNLSLTVRQDVLDEHPEIASVMAGVTELLTNESLQALNGSVDVDGLSPEAVAAAWLEESGLSA